MIENSDDKQLRLGPDGSISWQQDATNPMPGEVIAVIGKGEEMLSPAITLESKLQLDDDAKKAVEAHVRGWLERHLGTVLEPLFRLSQDDVPADGPVKEIATRLKEALGILPRQDLEEFITKLDEDGRRVLRHKKVRMGPLLVFQPELNKPAAIKLRALLWSLWHKDTPPTELPQDGIVSFPVEGKSEDEAFYRAIGYPVYGPRAVRVDMLDRVVCAVYDSAKDGKFQAQHQMAEWMGSNIADLYAVLEAMGHTKEHDPLEEKVKEEAAAEAPKEEAEKPAEPEETVEAKPEETAEKTEEKPAPAAKPELATFRLKRGKAIDSKPGFAGQKKDFKKNDGKSKPKRDKPKGKKPPRREPRERVYTAEAKKVEDSPFAILEQLKVGSKDQS